MSVNFNRTTFFFLAYRFFFKVFLSKLRSDEQKYNCFTNEITRNCLFFFNTRRMLKSDRGGGIVFSFGG